MCPVKRFCCNALFNWVTSEEAILDGNLRIWRKFCSQYCSHPALCASTLWNIVPKSHWHWKHSVSCKNSLGGKSGTSAQTVAASGGCSATTCSRRTWLNFSLLALYGIVALKIDHFLQKYSAINATIHNDYAGTWRRKCLALFRKPMSALKFRKIKRNK